MALVSWRLSFKKKFLDNKYTLDEMLIAQQEFDFDPSIIEYYEINNLAEINEMIFKFIESHNIHSNDVAVLGDNIGILRELDFEIRIKHQEDTITTFERKEEYEKLKQRGLLTQEKIEQIRRAKKVGFWLNAGMIKLSTVHSFKGWEIHTLFLLIDERSTFELVYTGITRARQNIIIINLGNTELSNFFSRKCSAKNFY